jgi:hypothetical protein
LGGRTRARRTGALLGPGGPGDPKLLSDVDEVSPRSSKGHKVI